jgi:hypothetical protein
MDFIFDNVHDLASEFSRNQAVLVYLPSINPNSLVHLALWHGSFDVRDYSRSGSKKLRDELQLTAELVTREGSRHGFVRVPKRPPVDDVDAWRQLITHANGRYLDEMKGHATTDTSIDRERERAARCISREWIDAFARRAPHYGVTRERMNRVCQSLQRLRTLDSSDDMKEDSCVIFYVTSLDRGRQSRLGLLQRDAHGWRPFERLMREVLENDSEAGSAVSRLTPFEAIDPYRHFITFELQLSHNHAIGNPRVRKNQADIVITDVAGRCLYIVEAKMAAQAEEKQLVSLLESIDDLTNADSTSVFRGYTGIPVLLLDRPDAAAISFHGRSLPVVTWRDVVRLASEIGIEA